MVDEMARADILATAHFAHEAQAECHAIVGRRHNPDGCVVTGGSTFSRPAGGSRYDRIR